MNPRLAKKNSGLIRRQPHNVLSCLKCKSYTYPLFSFCDNCSPVDPPLPVLGFPVVDFGAGFYNGKIITVSSGSGNFLVEYSPGLQTYYYAQDWLFAVEPDFSRIIVIEDIPKQCGSGHCNQPNYFDNPPNRGKLWICAGCRIIEDMQ